MQQPWEAGNAAREQAPDTSSIFTRVNYDERLKNAGRRQQPGPNGGYQPGQMYGYQPPVQSPPPSPAPYMADPAYMQPPVFDQQPLQPGAPYGANAYHNGPTPFVPTYEMPVWPEDEPEAQEEPQLRDAFEPAEDPKPLRKKAAPQKPPIRFGNVLALMCAAALLLSCILLGAKIITSLTESEQDLEAANQRYLEENGVDLRYAGVLVTLLPGGQTFPPTPSPTPTIFVQTPAPTPRLPVEEAAMAAAVMDPNATPTPTPSATPVLRTKQFKYPKNPMNNMNTSLETLRQENTDIVGRLLIPGVVDEVVVRRNNTRYLARSYLDVPNAAGAVFVDEGCTLDVPPENLLLRGNTAVSGKTFAPLAQYLTGGQAFATANAVCLLTTIYEEEQYVLFAVLEASNDPKSPAYFSYAAYPTFATDEAMAAYVQSLRSRSLYHFGVDVQPSDRLLTLATIGEDKNVVLVFRMARDGEFR